MPSFSIEIETDIKVDVSEKIVCGELCFSIIVAVKDGAHTSEPFRVIPHYTQSSSTVKRHISEREVAQNGIFVFLQIAG